MQSAGPIQTEIWGDAIRNAEPAEQKGSVFSEYVQKAHRLSERETSKPGWFWEPSVIGERAWKVRSELHGRLNVAHAEQNCCAMLQTQQRHSAHRRLHGLHRGHKHHAISTVLELRWTTRARPIMAGPKEQSHLADSSRLTCSFAFCGMGRTSVPQQHGSNTCSAHQVCLEHFLRGVALLGPSGIAFFAGAEQQVSMATLCDHAQLVAELVRPHVLPPRPG